jgi:hypothetical protein
MRRLHIALAVRDLVESIADYSRRFGVQPNVVVTGKYAMWRDDRMNFSINQSPDRAGQLRHLGFEDDAAAPTGYIKDRDVNGIEWELFSPAAQNQAILDVYGIPVG